jgi:predicted LPLAT superfamily acyltransferase
LEQAIEESPLDWFNFYPFWQQTRKKDNDHA